MKKSARIIIMAAGEAKAKQCANAIMLPQNKERPASILQKFSGARFYLTQGSSLRLTDRRTEDINILCDSNKISDEALIKTVCNLGLRLKKKILDLTAEDFFRRPSKSTCISILVQKNFAVIGPHKKSS
eukprot:UN23996